MQGPVLIITWEWFVSFYFKSEKVKGLNYCSLSSLKYGVHVTYCANTHFIHVLWVANKEMLTLWSGGHFSSHVWGRVIVPSDMAQSFAAIDAHYRYKQIHRVITIMRAWFSPHRKGYSHLLGGVSHKKIWRYNNSAPLYMTPRWLPQQIPPPPLQFPWLQFNLCAGLHRSTLWHYSMPILCNLLLVNLHFRLAECKYYWWSKQFK